jgi:MFS family permease
LQRSSTARVILPLVLPLYLPSLIFAFSMSLLIPVLPLFAKSFDIPYTLVGLMLSGDGIGMLIGDIPAGPIVRRFGLKQTMLAGIALVAVATSALFWAPSIPVVMLFRILSGFGVSLYSVSRHTWISSTIPTENRGRAISLLGGVFRMGKFAGPVVGGLIASAYGLRTPFLLFGIAYGIAFLNVAIFMAKLPEGIQQPNEHGKFATGILLETLKSQFGVLRTAGLGYLFLQMVRAGPSIFIPLFAADVLGMDVSTIGIIMSLTSAMDVAMFIPAGIIMDRLGRKYAIISSAVILVLGMSVIPFTSGMLTLSLAGVLTGFGNGLGSGTMLTLGADLAPVETRGEFLGFWRLIGDTGSTSAPMLMGNIADLFALPVTSWFLAGMGIVTILIFSISVKETLEKRKFPLPEIANQ